MSDEHATAPIRKHWAYKCLTKQRPLEGHNSSKINKMGRHVFISVYCPIGVAHVIT